MPIYNYCHEETGLEIEFARPVEMRNEPFSLTFTRSRVPEKPGKIIGIAASTMADDSRRGYYDLEQRNPDAFKTGLSKKYIAHSLTLPPPPNLPIPKGALG